MFFSVVLIWGIAITKTRRNVSTSISFSKKAGGRLALSLYVFLHNASAGLRDGGGGAEGGTCRECPNVFRVLYVR